MSVLTRTIPRVNLPLSDGPGLDAFNRLRVSSPTTLFDSQMEYNTSPLFWESSGGTVAHVAAKRAVSMSVAAGETCIRQTKSYHRYQPGKSQLVVMTGVLGASKADITQRIGYFDSGNGVFFEQTSSGLGLVLRTSTSGSPNSSRVEQASFNIDSMSWFDPTKANIFFFDIEWLGVGRVRAGVFMDGLPFVCHEWNNANNYAVPYMQTANLPLRYELVSGSTGTANDMLQICGAVISEGGFESERGLPMSASNGITGLTIEATAKATLSIRPKTTLNSITNRGSIFPESINLLATGANIRYAVVYGGSVAGGAFSSVSANSIAEYSVTSAAVTGGEVILQGYLDSGGAGQNAKSALGQGILSKLPLSLDIAGTAQPELSIVCQAVAAGTATVYSSMNWRELY